MMNEYPRDSRRPADAGRRQREHVAPFDAPPSFRAGPPNAASSAINFAEVVQALRHWWWQSAMAGLVLASAAIAAVWFTFKPVYESSAWLEIKSETPYLAFPDRSDSRAFSQTQLEMLRSSIVLSRVAAEPEVARIIEREEALSPELWLTRGLRVRFVGQSELCEVGFRAHDRSAAALVANAVVDEYLELHQDTAGEQTEQIIRILNDQQRERKAEVEALRERVRMLTKKTTGHDPVMLDRDQEFIVRRNPLAAAEEQRVAAEVREAVLVAELKALEDPSLVDRAEVPERELEKALSAHPDVQRLRQQALLLRSQVGEYKRTSARGAADPAAVRKEKQAGEVEEALRQRLQDLEPLVKEELAAASRADGRQAIQKAQLELNRVRSTRDEWNRREDEQRRELEKHGDEALNLEFARGDLERSEEVHARIAARIVALKTEKVAPLKAMKRREAVPPAEPLEAIPYKRLGMAGFGAFCIPFGLAFLWERWAKRISDGDRVGSLTNLRVLGEIAMLPSRSIMFDEQSAGFMRGRITFEESVDALRVALMFSPEFRDIHTFVVTSAVSREGKTSLASSLAISLAHACHEPVLLLDADMRAPDVHDLFGAALTPGLAEALSGACTVDEAVAAGVAANVDLLPAGALSVSPHSLFRKGRFNALLAELKPRYRYVVVDSPPVLSASEGLVIANACDGALVCTRCDFSRGQQLRSACDRLTATGTRLLGAVISAVPTRVWAQRYGGYGYGWERYVAPLAAGRRAGKLEAPAKPATDSDGAPEASHHP